MAERMIMDDAAINRALTRMSHEILEKNKGTKDIVLLGVKTRGVHLANRIEKKIKSIEDVQVPTGEIDVTHYRDDVEHSQIKVKSFDIEVDINDKHVIIVDDVLYTGRTVRASLDAILDHARPRKISLATLVDRGHRELPIRADYVGKNVPTASNESIVVELEEIDDKTAVTLN
ncbi:MULTISPECIES: bifunctional pyr operon transcriptional regulator/uracil phosphoribosyltransferase PyrR [Mammaliicoccus]|jgi:pyrimidine operon attenuation protein/uracil phosphoribosyltransferase|uniref:Bifunctional protein PyrR n=1 Tax=Mammaliicoccus lentus TaxID=42858 RepID=A0AAP1RRM2_MAMLE|nr:MULTISPECIES: bifunctional pyr operon transcriptional regulator/uracil phosphoribosyltransferase PyrR [Mammaliicoccus]HBV04274.1 bifunctional pyr operon transcriptional regulator/uracil phosphoribosyltransferase PyrR [Staphylococcus sp.]MBF0793851.1 bifunctional pyr operon transcriptional regulator/uracil phosphoribosyltransferase PyrR [Mammaliicoccus lentus]MBF0841580.1 bifunctional pyr operon transcriptional regulator/uracil phosphoribosyltransferase PyrR [Mammaliicoccus lentus]MBU6112470.